VRFSLKWILAGTVYVAIAAAAFGCGEWWHADILSVLALLAAAYAATLAVLARERPRWAGTGITVASICFVLWAAFGADGAPTTRVLAAAGLNPMPIQSKVIRGATFQGTTTDANGRTMLKYVTPDSVTAAIRMPPSSGLSPESTCFVTSTRAANAVATLAFGLMGSLVGLMAFRGSEINPT
jgi:hypothetical protein